MGSLRRSRSQSGRKAGSALAAQDGKVAAASVEKPTVEKEVPFRWPAKQSPRQPNASARRSTPCGQTCGGKNRPEIAHLVEKPP